MKKIRIYELESLLERKDEEIGRFKQKIEIEWFGKQWFLNDDFMMIFYIGFILIVMFLVLFDYVKFVVNCMISYYYKISDK